MSFFSSLPHPVPTYHSKTYDRIAPRQKFFNGTGKTILITGAATGIGFAIARSFAEAGVARIIITSRSSGPQLEAKQHLHTTFPEVEILTFSAAVTDHDKMNKIMSENGPIDVLVLNAAYVHAQAMGADVPMAEIEESFAINVIGNFAIVQAYLKLPKPAAGLKTVVNVSTAAIHLNVGANSSGYSASKLAFTKLMARLAGELTLDKDQVKLVSYHPGAIFTPTAKRSGFTEDSFAWEDANLPGNFAVWLAGSESDFLHGKFVWAHWDVDELIALKGRCEKEEDFLTMGLIQ